MCMYMCIHIHTYTHIYIYINILYIYLFSFHRIPEMKWNLFTFAYLQRQFCWSSLNLLNSHFFLSWAIDDLQSCVIFRCIESDLDMYIHCIYIYIYFNSNADGEWRPHEEPTTDKSHTESPENLYAFSWFCIEIASPPCLMLPGRTALGSPCRPPVFPCGDPSWRAVRTARFPGPGPSSQPLLPRHTLGSWLTPAPVNPSGSSKPQRVCTGQELGV